MVRRRVSYVVSLALLASVASPALAQDLPAAAQPQEIGLSQEGLQRVDAKMEKIVREGRVPGAVALIARNGRIAYYKAFGMSDPAKKRPMRKDDIFRVYSQTKAVMSIGLMMLLEEGKFQLTDPLEKYIPSFKDLKVYVGTDDKGEMILEEAKRKPTIQDAMRHTLGLTNAGTRGPVERHYLEQGITFTRLESLEQEMDLLSQNPLVYQPGERWLYAKGADVQGYLIERLSGMPLDKFLQERLLGPLGMKDTGYGVPASKADRIAQYDGPIEYPTPGNPGLDMRPETYERFATRPFGTSGLWSTAMDFARLSQMLLNGGELDGVRILSRKSIELMTQNNLPAAIGDLSATGDPGIGFGLGFSVALDPAAAGKLVSPGTFGWTGAATSSFSVDPQEKMVIIFMAQKWPYDEALLDEFHAMALQTIAD